MKVLDFQKVTIADLHIHSKYSRACSKDLSFENLVKWAKIKGIDLLGTGDFTHPVWIEEIKKLKDEKNGFYSYDGFPFVVTGEVSLIYKDNEKTRKVHLVILVPSVEVAEKINNYFDKKNLRRDYDGRPIFKISCEDFVKDMRNISESIEIFPAHIWTPWFGVLGSKGGYNSLKEAFGSQEKYVNAIETGISSDIEMNSKIKELKNKTILSFSDSHSFWPWRLGREVTIFNKLNSYNELLKQIRENKIIGTVEVEPAYGMYHFDGHRNCDFVCSPEETKKINKICPKCGKELTVGVDYRVEELKNKEQDENSLFKLLPLHEIISLYLKKGISAKSVWNVYWELLKVGKNEFDILINVSEEKLLKVVDEKLVDLIIENRNGKIKVKPGYDGIYGEALI